MKTTESLDVHIYSEQDLDETELHPITNGSVAVFTARSPDKDTVNEDAAAVVALGTRKDVLIVADGLGGLPAGQQAARIAIDTLIESLQLVATDQTSLREAILDGIEKANERVCALGTGAATTLAVVEIQDSTIRSYHVGDSLILLTGQRGKIKLQNVPHSPTGYAVESGLLEEMDAVHHEQRNIVSNVIGMPEMHIEVGPSIPLSARDTLVLASDGLADNLYVHEMVDYIRKGRLQHAANELAKHCRQRMLQPQADYPSHADDLTFIIFRGLQEKAA